LYITTSIEKQCIRQLIAADCWFASGPEAILYAET